MLSGSRSEGSLRWPSPSATDQSRARALGENSPDRPQEAISILLCALLCTRLWSSFNQLLLFRMRLHERIRSCPLFLGLVFVLIVLSSTRAQLTVGGSGRCLSFMKVGQYAQAANLTALNDTRSFTVELWARSFSPSQTFALFSLVTPSRMRCVSKFSPMAHEAAQRFVCRRHPFRLSLLIFRSSACARSSLFAFSWALIAFLLQISAQ